MFIEGIIGLLLVVIIWLYYTDGDDPLDKLPNPPRLPILGHVFQIAKIRQDKLLEAVIEFVESYGDRFSYKILRQRFIHITRPSDVAVVLSHSKNITKTFAYDFLKGWLGTGLLLNTGDHWHKRRKILTPTFHFNILKNFFTVMEERGSDLVNLLKEKKGADVDVLPVISDYTLFNICETAMGTKLDKDKSAATIEYKNAIQNIGMLLIYRLTKFWLYPEFIYRNSPTGKKFYKILNTVRSFADNVIRDKKAQRVESKVEEVTTDEDIGTKRKLAMLDLLLEAEVRGEIDIDGIRDEVNTFIFEGHDTISLAITFGLMLLADHDDVQERIFWELQGILNNSDRSPSMSDMADMKYMEAVIKEILRLYPSVPFIGREIEEDFMLDDVLVKKGTIVGLHIYQLHHREDMFPDAEAFKPERFLPGSELKHPFSYVPFSAGPRNCIGGEGIQWAREQMFCIDRDGVQQTHGQRFAMQELKITFCEIIRNFKLVPKVKGARPRLITDMVLRPAEPIYIKFIPRK